MTCLWAGCNRAAPVSPSGTLHAHCAQHEARLTREAFGPVSWTDRALTNTLPPLVVGGVSLDSPSSPPPVPPVSPERVVSGRRSRQSARALPAVQAG